VPRRRGSALALGCGRDGRVVLPLARAAAVSTGLRVHAHVPALDALVGPEVVSLLVGPEGEGHRVRV
jgi:hypothetical protein